MSGSVLNAGPWLTVLVPAHNEAASLAGTVEAVRAALRALGVAFEVLVVDDGSVDGTAAVAHALAVRWAEVRVHRHGRNLGLGAGVRTGIAEARGEWLILIPADLALEPDDLGRYVAAAPGADVVVGVSSHRRDSSAFRRLVTWVNIQLIRLLFHMPLRQFNYISLYRLSQLRRIEVASWHSAFFFAEILIRIRDGGGRLVEVDVRYRPRRVGHATGARWPLIVRTLVDLLKFWLRRGLSARRVQGVEAGAGESRPRVP